MKALLSSAMQRRMAGLLACLIIGAMIGGMAGCGERQVTDAIEIRTWYDLHAIRDDVNAKYILMNDLDSTTEGYMELASPTADGGRGWLPIRTPGAEFYGWFTGVFEGQGYEIRDLYINRPDTNKVGLFAQVTFWGEIRNVGVVDADVTGGDTVGGLVGMVWRGGGAHGVSDCYFSGSVTGGDGVGGLVGENVVGTVRDCYATGSVTGSSSVGGLVGRNKGTVSDCCVTGRITGSSSGSVGGLVGSNWEGTVRYSCFDGAVSGYEWVGGLVGQNHGEVLASTVSNSYSGGNVTGSHQQVGGLVGRNSGMSTVIHSYSNANVTGGRLVGGLVGVNADGATVSRSSSSGFTHGYERVGGLVGINLAGSTVSNSYATGDAFGSEWVGGLVGENHDGTVNNCYGTGWAYGYRYVGGLLGVNHLGTVSNSYSSGNVTGVHWIGGLVGLDIGTVSNSFWDTEQSGLDNSSGGTGKTTAEMQSTATFSETETEGLDEPWEIIAVAPGATNDAYIWNIIDGVTYPFLSWQRV